jgi:DNA-binding SARP family transcriptional activator/tetratricopeptide (TPR) repeat protein
MSVSRWEHHVDVLGPVLVRGAGDIVPVTRSMEIGVLGLLALNAGSPVSSGSLIDMLWPEDPPRTAGKTLQGYVKRVRGMVAVNGLELTHGGPSGYVLKVAPNQVDAIQFESLVAHARTSADDAARLRRIDDALAVWRGEPFAGCELAGIQPHREWLLRLCGATRIDRVAAQIRLGVTAETIGGIRALLIEEPTNERLWLHLAGASYLAGNPVAALEAIAEARRELVERAGVEPGPELAELQRHLLDHDDVPGCYARLTGAPRPTLDLGGSQSVSPARSSTTLTLPKWEGELLGRDDAVGEIVDAVAEGCSIVTVVAPGGMGKTRCAVEAARRSPLPCRGFLDLSALLFGAELALHLAGSFGVPDRDDPVAAVASQLVGEPCTVVLDNVEQIEGAPAVLDELVAWCPSVVWLVTSQIELGLARERIVRLDPLSTSVGDEPGPSAALLTAAARRRGVRLTPDAPVADIAARIGGIPLALELAACQLQYLRPDTLLHALAEPLDALVDPRRSVGRHRSMRACFDLGLARLGADATDLFAIVSHRPGGCRYEDLATWWTRPTPLSRAVAELVEGGLAATSADAAGATRLTQLPLVRSLGRSLPRPADADAADGVLDLAVLGRAQASLTGADPAVVEPDLPDIRRLLQHGVDDPAGTDLALQLAVLLAVYWWSSRITEGRRWLDALLSRTGEQPSPLRPYGIQTAAFLDFYVGDGESANRRLDEALATDVPDPNAASRLLALRAMLDAAAGDHTVASQRATRAVELARLAGDEEVLSYALGNGGDVANAGGEIDLARERYVECIDRMRRRGLHWLSAAPHARLADMDVSAGEHRRARMWFERSITLWSSRELGPGAPQTLAGLGRLDALDGDLDGARRHLAVALSTAEGCGSRGEYPWIVLGYAALMAASQRRDEAAVLFGLALRHGPRAGHCVRRLVEAELGPLYAWAVPDPQSVATDPRVLATPLEDLPAALTAIVAG